jgi:putative oxidoreductase
MANTEQSKNPTGLAAVYVRAEPIVYNALRIIAGAMFMLHGIQKTFGLWGADPAKLSPQLQVGGYIELVTGIMIALGIGTRAAAFLASGQMAVAYFQFHWKFAFDERILPLVNGGDDTVLYCFVFLLFTVRGAGAASIDAVLAKRKQR